MAYTDLKSSETSQLPTFYQYLQKSQLHSFKLPVNMETEASAGSAPPKISEVAANAKSDVFASAVTPATQEPAKFATTAAPQQQFEKANYPSLEINQSQQSSSKAEDLKKMGTVYHNPNSQAPSSGELQNQIAAYKRMIEKE